jgi:dihydroorotase (multifunctional complex type)
VTQDLNILGADVVSSRGIAGQSVAVRGGIITEVTANPLSLSPCGRVIDASGQFLFPGMIDSHVHIRGGGFSYREDYRSGSRAAMSAGVTTVLEMPGSDKPASTLGRFLDRVREISRDREVRFGLYGGAGGDNTGEIPKMAAAGAVGFKTFQMPPVAGREGEFYGLCSETEEDLLRCMRAVRETGKTLTVHCESQEIIDASTPAARREDPEGLRGFILSRPPEAETESVRLTLACAARTGCRTIIAHVSCPESMEMILEYRRQNHAVFAETCAHYLCFDMEQMIPYGVFARMKPPFRDRDRVDRMAAMFSENRFSVIGSDHAPFTAGEKTRHGTDVWKSADGLCGLELSLPLLLTLTEQGKAGYANIAYSFSESPAQIFGLGDRGRIEPGYLADMVLVRKRDVPMKLDHSKLHSKCRDSAVICDGIETVHEITGTILGGRVVFEEGKHHLSDGADTGGLNNMEAVC